MMRRLASVLLLLWSLAIVLGMPRGALACPA
jgi:hypothetical protein